MHLPAKANSLSVKTFMANKTLPDSDSESKGRDGEKRRQEERREEERQHADRETSRRRREEEIRGEERRGEERREEERRGEERRGEITCRQRDLQEEMRPVSSSGVCGRCS